MKDERYQELREEFQREFKGYIHLSFDGEKSAIMVDGDIMTLSTMIATACDRNPDLRKAIDGAMYALRKTEEVIGKESTDIN